MQPDPIKCAVTNSRKSYLSKVIVFVAVLLLVLVVYVVHYVHTMRLVNAALLPCASTDQQHFHFTDSIPCYQNALRIDPGNNYLKIRLADELTYAGKFNEARPLYQQVAGVFGLFQSEARRKLAPGEMQKQMESVSRSVRILHDLQTMTAHHQAEEEDFIKLRDSSWHEGMPLSFTGTDKEQWLEMRQRHSQEEAALQKKL